MKITRLPVDIFRDLDCSAFPPTFADHDLESSVVTVSPEELRSCICSKLSVAHGTPVTRQYEPHQKHPPAAVLTTGQLLQMSPFTLLRAVDPLLTFGKLGLV